MCDEELARGCGGEGLLSIECQDGYWKTIDQCPGNHRCDSTPESPTFAACLPVINLCATETAGNAVCDGFRRKRCGADLIRLEDYPCQANAHCERTTHVACVCDVNYKDDGSGNCVPDITCPTNACSPGGRCVAGATDYACECDPEFEGTGTKSCTLVGPCTMATVCSTEYVCRSRGESYVCRGQFADWLMHSTLPSAKAAPNFLIDPELVTDAVTGLVWQRNLPAMYPPCSAGGCSWMQATSYCETLELEGKGWRLPTLIELVSILDEGAVEPSIDAEAFPNTPLSGFWSASPHAASRNEAWVVNFGAFRATAVNMTSLQSVRCVR